MNPNRRRKKRPSYGVRTVEIARGRHGFGFTISGQAPCILSSIVSGSPADRAGLRTGDYLIAVDGRNVSKALHDSVVRMIGGCHGLLKIQIAENYYSNSSDEDDIEANCGGGEYDAMPIARPRHRFRHRHNQHAARLNAPVLSGAAKQLGEPFPMPSWRRHASCAIQDANDDGRRQPSKYLVGPPSTPLSSKLLPVVAKSDRRLKLMKKDIAEPAWREDAFEKENRRPPHVFKESQYRHRERSTSPVASDQLPSAAVEDFGILEEPIYRAVVGYLGTIEMPKEPQVSGRRLSAIHSCIRRLRVEKKVHTLVFLRVFCHCVTLTDSSGTKLAEYPTTSIAFCGAYADDKRFFGLVTARTENSVVEQLADGSLLYSSSCHVFMADGKLVRHEEHARRAMSFHLECTPVNPVAAGAVGGNECAEFPDTVDPILMAIVGLYRGRAGIPMDLDANVSPQPSHTSSNSDSGIGFRDEGQSSDRVSVADVDPEFALGLPPQPNAVFGCPKESRSRANSCGSGTMQPSKKDNLTAGRLAVRAMLDPSMFTSRRAEDTSFNTKHLDAEQEPSKVRLSVQKYFQRRFAEQEHGRRESSRMADFHSRELQPPRAMSPVLITLQSRSEDTETIRLASVERAIDIDGHQAADDLDGDSAPSFPDDITENTCEQEGSQDVHPPTQGEDSDSSAPDNDDTSPEDGDDGDQRWPRVGSFSKLFRIPFGQSCKLHDDTNFNDGCCASHQVSGVGGLCNDDAGVNDDDDCASSSRTGSVMDVGRVGSWAITFEKLLADPAGLHTFAEFLKKEFSYENITFWVACERYRKSEDKSQMKELAREVFERHLGQGALEPVNVDSRARHLTENGLSRPDRNLFAQAQNQIYNLMKFDCYARFLKSPLYRECMLKEVAGDTLPYLGAEELDPELPFPNKADSKCKKEKSEDRRRKSLLPWHRTKSGKLKKDKSNKAAKKENPTTISSSWSDLTSSRSSLASSDVPPSQKPSSAVSSSDDQPLCKLHLPDHSTTVVPVRSGEIVSNWLRQLLDRRGIDIRIVEVRFVDDSRLVDLGMDSSLLSGSAIRVQQRTDVCPRRSKPQTSLNELTSKVFDDLLRGRRSSVESGHLLRRVNDNGCPPKPPIAARPPNLQPLPRKNSDEMYELWKRTQCSRLDDQRGTEINFELPEFLKTQPEDGGRCHHLDGRTSEPVPSRIVSNLDDTAKLLTSAVKSRDADSLLVGGVIPTHEQAEKHFGCTGSKSAMHLRRDLKDVSSAGMNPQVRCNLSRPCSHPPPKSPAPWLRSASVPVCDVPNSETLMAALSPVKEAPPSTTFSMDSSLTPSSVPLPMAESSIHVNVADYPPPSPLELGSTKSHAAACFPMTPPPPPLPPKPRLVARGPVPPVPTEGESGYKQRASNSCKRGLKELIQSDKFSISFV